MLDTRHIAYVLLDCQDASNRRNTMSIRCPSKCKEVRKTFGLQLQYPDVARVQAEGCPNPKFCTILLARTVGIMQCKFDRCTHKYRPTVVDAMLRQLVRCQSLHASIHLCHASNNSFAQLVLKQSAKVVAPSNNSRRCRRSKKYASSSIYHCGLAFEREKEWVQLRNLVALHIHKRISDRFEQAATICCSAACELIDSYKSRCCTTKMIF